MGSTKLANLQGPAGTPGTIPTQAAVAEALAGPIAGPVINGLITAGVNAAAPTVSDDAIASAQVMGGIIPRRRMETPPSADQGKYVGMGGGAAQSPGSGFAVGDELTIAGGTFTVPAIARVTSVSGGAITGFSTIQRGIYTVAPASPVSIASSTGGSTNATLNVGFSTASVSGIKNAQSVGPTDARYRITATGPWTNIGGSGYYGSANNALHSIVEWATDSVTPEIRLIGVNSNLVLYVDGQQTQAGGIMTDTSGGGYIRRLDFKGAKRLRNFKLIGANMGFGGVQVESDAIVTAPTTPARKLAWVLGDSYTFGNGAQNLASQAAVVMGEALDIDVLPCGIGGTGWTASGSSLPATRVNANLANLTRTPDIVIFDLGYNDGYGGANMTTLTTNLNNAVDAAQALVPAAQFLAFGPATPLGSTANLSTVKAAISAAMATQGVPFIDAENWVNAGNKALYTDADNIHPSALGHKYLGARKALAARRVLTLP